MILFIIILVAIVMFYTAYTKLLISLAIINSAIITINIVSSKSQCTHLLHQY